MQQKSQNNFSNVMGNATTITVQAVFEYHAQKFILASNGSILNHFNAFNQQKNCHLNQMFYKINRNNYGYAMKVQCAFSIKSWAARTEITKCDGN